MNNYFNITNLNFGLLSKDEIINLSVCEITNSKLSGPNSIYDSRLGTLMNNKICPICNQNNIKCTGHFSHINLNIDVIHPLCRKEILVFLNCFCYKCSNFLLSKTIMKINNIFNLKGKNRIKKIIEISSKQRYCKNCNIKQPQYTINPADNNIYMVYKNSGDIMKTQLFEHEIKHIFANICNKDIKLLGLNPDMIKPENLILSVLPVLPIASRPYIITQNLTCDDDLTIQYLEIIKANNHLTDTNLSEIKRQKYIHTLKFRINCLFDNTKDKAKHTNGRPMKGIKKRLCGKEGQIRNNLMGKRVDKSARTVIGPGPHLKLNQIEIPKKFAETLTYPIKVNSLNHSYLSKLITEQKANYVIKNNGTRINLKYAFYNKRYLLEGDEIHRGDIVIKVTLENYPKIKDTDRIKRNGVWIENEFSNPKYELEEGEIVERHLQNGDIVLLNRQPTLHKGSMMAQKIVIGKDKTIKMNLAITKPYNADFDGDEMNIHTPCDLESEAELRMISDTQNNLISSQASKPSISIVQDSLLGAYLMTLDKKAIPKEVFFQIIMKINYNFNIVSKINYIKKILKNKNPYTGKGLVSLLLPANLNYEKKNNASKTEPIFKIYKGVIISGVINKAIIGSSHNSLIQILNKEYSMKITLRFINNIQFIANEWLLYNGFSIGVKDCIATKESEIRKVVSRCFLEAKGVEETTKHPKIKEIKITASLSKARDHGMKIAKDALNDNNNFISTVTSGSKGDYFNIAQITGLLGQQCFDGVRINPVLNQNTRTLPHYDFEIKEKDVEYESRGFIRHSFSHGLNPREFWFHAITGREGVTDTAMKTATSGYIQRRMVKAIEDIQIKYDGTVRNANDRIIQFNYGDNNLDCTKAIIVNGKPQACNISRLVGKLNLNHELTKKK